MAGGPGGDSAPTRPVSLRLFSQRLIEGNEIPKTLATSSRGIPRSTASNTFSLRSSEYALMHTLSLRIKEYATRCESVRRLPVEAKLGLRRPGPFSCPYSPECLEVVFSEVHLQDPA
jgi:hypothetical protein